jgi:hypothetical protein
MLRAALLITWVAACTSAPPRDLPEHVVDAQLVLRRADDGTVSASADILNTSGCTIVVDEAVTLNGREMTGGYTAGVDRCVQSRYLYQLDGMRSAARFELVIDMSRIGCSIVLFTLGCMDSSVDDFVDDTPPSERHRVFYLRNGTLGKIMDSADTRTGIETADAECTAAAGVRDLGGTWRAWLSSSTVDAADRITDVAPWYRGDRETLLFASKQELTRGPRSTIEATPDAEPMMFWSGTHLDGTRSTDNCSDWTVYNRPAIATVGRVDVIGERWVMDTPLLCSTYLALLCIEQ